MARLFIELYLDEDINVLIANLLRGRGFSAVTTRDERQLQNSDDAQLTYAVSQQKTLLTTTGPILKRLPRNMPLPAKSITASSWPRAIPLTNLFVA